MARAILIHWKAAEAEGRLAALRDAGYDARLGPPAGSPGWRDFGDPPPDVIVIDLDRMPSHGRAVGIALRQQKKTRAVPLVFAGGLPEKVERVRRELPDARYCGWDSIGDALRSAPHPAAAPVVPKDLGYSGSPLPKKLGIRPGETVALLGAPARFERKLEPLPEGVRLVPRARGAGRVLLFAPDCAALARRFPGAADGVAAGGALWILWPKQSSGAATDLTQPFVRAFALDAGWVDYKICAVDETWSGLLFARKRTGRT